MRSRCRAPTEREPVSTPRMAGTLFAPSGSVNVTDRAALLGPVIAALAALARRFGDPVAIFASARLDGAWLEETLADLDRDASDPDLILGCLYRGTLPRCPVRSIASGPALLPIVELAPSGTIAAARAGALAPGELLGVVRGLGWSPRVVAGAHLERDLDAAVAWARHEIRVLQETARAGIVPSLPGWPLVLVLGPITGAGAGLAARSLRGVQP
jgi:hypothetical protein